jgi:hypothetical protein
MTTIQLSPETGFDQTDFLPVDAISGIDQSKPCDIECLCPFCGAFNSGVGKPCVHCALEDSTATRSATSQRTGPWFVLQSRNPLATGMTFDTLQSLIRREIVTPRSVVRGPTTGQLWRLASKVRGISREFGQCFACGQDIAVDATECPNCQRVQTLPETAEARGKLSTAPEMQQIPADNSAPIQAQFAVQDKPVQKSLDEDWMPSRDELLGPAESAAPNPVMAAHLERHIPKEDLLTPKDVAKAFMLEFGPATEPPVRRPPTTIRWNIAKIKVGLAVAAVLILSAGVWPIIRAVAGLFQSDPPVAVVMPVQSQMTPTPANNVTINTDAQLANEIAVPPPMEIAAAAVPPVAPEPLPAPVAQSTRHTETAYRPAIVQQIVYKQPSAVTAPEMTDDPKELLRIGMEAESRSNFAAAVSAYERIQSLPSSSWPPHLDVRLALARRELRGDCR